MSCLSSETLLDTDAPAQRFVAARPFRHVAIPGFLRRDLCQRLLEDFPRFEDRHALNETGEVGGKAVRMDVRALSPASTRRRRPSSVRERLSNSTPG